MKKTILTSSILIHFLVAMSQVDTAFINGKIHSGNVKFVIIDWLVDNPIKDVQKAYRAQVDQDGRFMLKIPLSNIANGRILAGDFAHDVSLLPKDNMFVDIDGETIKYQGKGSEKNNFLYHIELKGFQNEMYDNEIRSCKLSPKEFAIKMGQFRDKRIELLNEFSKINAMEQSFKDFFLAENSVIYNNLILFYPLRYAFFNNIPENTLELSDEYKRCRQLSNIVDNKKVISSTYLRDFLPYKATELRELHRNMNDDPYYIIMLDSLKGKTQEYVMARWICSDLSRDRLDSFIYDKFKSLAKDEFAINTVATTLKKFQERRALIGQPLNDAFFQTPVEDTIENTFTFGKLMEKYKGKVVYLDIWGLGYEPCKAAMPLSKKLREKLSGKPIEFVFFTVEEMSEKRWNEAFKVCLTKNNQYRLKDGFNSIFLQFKEVNGIPCYMIFDKDGKLMDYSAPEPGEYGLEEKLIELAEKN